MISCGCFLKRVVQIKRKPTKEYEEKKKGQKCGAHLTQNNVNTSATQLNNFTCFFSQAMNQKFCFILKKKKIAIERN